MSFIENITAMANRGEGHQGSVAIMQHVNDMLYAGQVDECNALLDSVDVSAMPSRMALAFVTITRLVPDETLPAKSDLYRRVCNRVAEEVGGQRAEDIVYGGTLLTT